MQAYNHYQTGKKTNGVAFVFGHLLATYRERRGMNKTEFAKAAGVSQPYVMNIESGRKPPPQRDTLYRMVTVLRLTDEEQENFVSAAIWERMSPDDQQMFRDLKVSLAGSASPLKCLYVDKNGEIKDVGDRPTS
jgi:transcriptional regulator with XRE-family HTH domain